MSDTDTDLRSPEHLKILAAMEKEFQRQTLALRRAGGVYRLKKQHKKALRYALRKCLLDWNLRGADNPRSFLESWEMACGDGGTFEFWGKCGLTWHGRLLIMGVVEYAENIAGLPGGKWDKGAFSWAMEESIKKLLGVGGGGVPEE